MPPLCSLPFQVECTQLWLLGHSRNGTSAVWRFSLYDYELKFNVIVILTAYRYLLEFFLFSIRILPVLIQDLCSRMTLLEQGGWTR